MATVGILHVGGTIGMASTPEGLKPQDGFVGHYLETMAQVSTTELPSWELHTLYPLQDSANTTPDDWIRIADRIVELAPRYDGLVVLHGTDTLCYTASALSFLLHGLTRPVILTGAQLSLESVRSDGREHIITSMLLASQLPVPEVCIYFGSRLLRGNRAQKIHNQEFVAFASGNLPPLAKVGVSIDVRHHLVRASKPGPIRRIRLTRQPEVVAVRIFPGLRADLLRRILAKPVEGVVLETYGTGTFPSADAQLLDVIREATARGVVVVNCSQCHSGRVQQGLYGTGAALESVGVISGHDMTPEAALTKLYCLLAHTGDISRVRMQMQSDTAGELTP